MFIRSILAATCIGALGACASITSDSMQTLRVETLDKDGKSVAYNYPAWVQLIFGEPQVFDRMHREDGKPT